MNEVHSPKKPLIFYYMVAMLLVMLFNFIAMPWLSQYQIQEVDYNTFVSMVEKKEIGKVDLLTSEQEVALAQTMVTGQETKRQLEEMEAEGVARAAGICIDDLDVSITHYDHPQPELLRADAAEVVEEALHSHLLKSNCPVTGQPDWGTLVVDYHGPRLEAASLLAYVVSFRQHQDFHEQCVERVFLDLQRLLQPERLTVYARYVRRGGLDINPYRSTEAIAPDNRRLVRQ